MALNSGVWGGAPGETAGLASTFWEESRVYLLGPGQLLIR